MKFKIAKQEDRDQMCVILVRNGYTVRQGKEKRPDSKAQVSFVEVVEDGKQ